MVYGTRHGIIWRAFVWVSWCLLGMACSDQGVPVTPVAPVDNDSGSIAQTDEADLHASVAGAMQRDASEVYAVAEEGPGRYFFANQARRLTATADRAGLVVRAVESSSSFSLRTNAFGCEGAMREVMQRDPAAVKNRVSYAHPEWAMEEWYLNGPLGVEQGFTIAEAPQCTGMKVITMEALGDAAPVLEDADGDGRGDWVRFVEEDGQTRFVYRDLDVVDAAGKKLPAWMTVEAGGITIHFDDAGAVYPVEVDPLIMVLEAMLLAADGTSGDIFGFSVAIDGDTALVGAYGDDFVTCSGMTCTTSASQGSAYVFVRNAGVWTQQAKLVASDGAELDKFGASVALDGDTAIVGAPFDDEKGTDSGSAYVFVRNAGMGVWAQQAKLTASDGAAGDNFGVSAALSGDTAIVGAWGNDVGANADQGSAYVFVRIAGVWTDQQKLIAADGAAFDQFGSSIALDGYTSLIGAPYDDDLGTHAGSAYVFVLSGAGIWIEQAKWLAPGGAASDLFGYSVALSGDTALVGAPIYDDGVTSSDFGAAFVYMRNGSTWTWQQKLTAVDRKPGDWFGFSVALDGDTACIGALNTDEFGTNSGSAYVFIRNGSWNLRDKLLPNPGAALDQFGVSVALSGDTALVGAPFGDIGATVDQGSAFVFAPRKTNGDACATAIECASGSCTDGVCCDSPCAGPCQACSLQTNGIADGYCINFAEVTDPENDCNMDPTSTCQQDGFCDGNGACRLWASGTLCGSNVCAGNFSKLAVCNGLGTCGLDAIGTDCGVNGCDPVTGQCITACSTNADCTADAFCDSTTSQCKALAPLGKACSAPAQCQSGHCVDNVCCNEACDGLCRACNADGICSAGAEDLACAADPMNPCGNTGQCTDVGTCAFATNGTVCATPSCSDGIAQTSSCDGNGTCVATTTPCGNYACDAAACKTSCSSNQDCNKDAYCDQAQCKSRAIIASVCSVDQECKSEHCVEAADVDPDAGPLKICCEAPCKDDPDNECGQTGRCTVTGECEVEPLGKKCGSAGCSNDGHRYGRQICASGKCIPDPSVDVDCSPYPCESALSCKSSCNSDAECLSEYECRKGRCGTKTCDENRKCLDRETCDPNTKMCISASADSDGCTCQTPGSHSLNSRWPAMFVALALLMLRRAQSPHFFSRRES